MDLWIDARMIQSSGIGTVLKNVIPRLTSFKVHLILHSNDKEWQHFPHRICNAPIYSIEEQWELPRLIPKCDLFWSPHYNVPIFPLKAHKRAVTIHDACHLAFNSHLNWKQRLYAQLMFRQAVRRSHSVITDSIFSQNELSRFLSYPKEKIQIIYPGVNQERFQTQGVFKKNHSLPPSFLLFVGNLKPHKNLRSLLSLSLPLPLVVVGKKEGLRHIDPVIFEASPNQNVLFTGEIEDSELPAFYQKATALIFPSLYEGFGLPPLEAMAAGCPVLVSNRASIPEVCGNAASIFDPDYPTSILQSLDRILQNRNLWIEKGKMHVAQFKWQTTAEKYIKLFAKTICSPHLTKGNP